MSLPRSTTMYGKIVECHVKRIKGKKPIFTGTQVFGDFSDQENKQEILLLARDPEALQRSYEK